MPSKIGKISLLDEIFIARDIFSSLDFQENMENLSSFIKIYQVYFIVCYMFNF